ncbi:DUF499 domain-containing protein [Actinomycetospora callitridis]|uniref:DUF499 domain-containing protein n=1 Tax=Actinomycetospora callitridis TaxID=913944 RepID=UPI002365E031|nr:DUF499 domain-containing protein [Actinomycetospora callitridis]MDD7920013.1 DUF499 domain-containing protein [Actinomycetospora callitridis]
MRLRAIPSAGQRHLSRENRRMTLLRTLTPRQDVMAGELTEGRFAAGLEDVASGTAADAYRKPESFFAQTYPSEGLRTLLNEALGRVGGTRPDAASVLRLETNFGGGKTHNLIALFHAARTGIPADLAVTFMDPAVLAGAGVTPATVAVFVGTSAGASTFPTVHGIAARTPWGYLALQIGGLAAYEIVRGDDEALSAPGSDQLKRIFEGKPVLILIDEIARYLSAAGARKVAESTLAKQTLSFLMALLEAADSSEQVVVVITTAGETDAFAADTEDLASTLKEVASLLARKELVLRPSGEADLPKILARRLFETDLTHLSEKKSVALRYAEAAESAHAAGLDLPPEMVSGSYAKDIETSYPFHPDLVRVLDKRLSTIPNFQRTRGALRLLARVIRRTWGNGVDLDLIHLHNLDLSDSALAEDLSSRIDRPLYEPVIRADIAQQAGGAPSHADEVDSRMGTPYGRRLATTAYLFSLTREVPGVSASDLYGAVLTPGNDANLIVKALDGLETTCWYLHADVRGYRFSTEASLVRLVQEAEDKIPGSKVRERATKILSEQFKDSAFKVRRAWEDAKIPDNSEDAYLVVYHWDDFGDGLGVDPDGPVPRKVAETYEKSPGGGVREYRNRLVFLAPSSGGHEPMLRAVRRLLALEQLRATPELLATLGEEKRADVGKQASAATGLARVAVCNHVNVLYVPGAGELETVVLGTITSASLVPNQTDAILERLESMDKTLVAGSKPLDPAYVRSKLGAQFDSPQPTMEVARAFARRPDLKIVLDRQQLVNLLIAGVRNGVWEYQAPGGGADSWATAARPGPTPRLGEDVLLNPPGSYKDTGPEACPLCDQVHTGPCASGGGAGGAGISGGGDSTPAVNRFHGSGAAGPALVTARTAAAEADKTHVTGLHVEVAELGDHAGKELQRLLTLAPGTGPKATVTYDITARIQLDSPEHEVNIVFRGTAAEYSPLNEALRALLKRPADLKATVDLAWPQAVELQGPEVANVVKAAQSTGPTKCGICINTQETP